MEEKQLKDSNEPILNDNTVMMLDEVVGDKDQINKNTIKCGFCTEDISTHSFKQHTAQCGQSSKFMNKISGGYQCNKCMEKRITRGSMFLHLKICQPNDINCDKNLLKASTSNLKKQCEFCQEVFANNSLNRHIGPCRLYSKFMKRTSLGYQCLVCLKEKSRRHRMFYHIQTSHRNLKDQDFISEISNDETITPNKSDKSVEDMLNFDENQLNMDPMKDLNDKTVSPIKLDGNVDENNQNSMSTRKCEFCADDILTHLIKGHTEQCKQYSKFMKNISDGYQCNHCSKTCVTKSSMF